MGRRAGGTVRDWLKVEVVRVCGRKGCDAESGQRWFEGVIGCPFPFYDGRVLNGGCELKGFGGTDRGGGRRPTSSASRRPRGRGERRGSSAGGPNAPRCTG